MSDFGVDPHGLAYLVMEYVECASLKLADFGIARAMNEASVTSPDVVHEGKSPVQEVVPSTFSPCFTK